MTVVESHSLRGLPTGNQKQELAVQGRSCFDPLCRFFGKLQEEVFSCHLLEVGLDGDDVTNSHSPLQGRKIGSPMVRCDTTSPSESGRCQAEFRRDAQCFKQGVPSPPECAGGARVEALLRLEPPENGVEEGQHFEVVNR